MKKINVFLLALSVFLATQSAWINAQTVYTLNDCVRLSLKNNLQMKNASLDIQSVQSRINEAKSGFLPSVDINGQYQYYITMPKMLVPAEFFGGKKGEYDEFVMGSPQTTSASLQVTQVLYNQKVFIGLRAAKTAKNMTELQLSKTKEDLIYNVSAVFYNLQVIRQNLNLLDSNLITLNKLVETSKVLQQNDIMSRTGFKRLMINRDNLVNERNNLKLTNDKAYNLLKFLLGVPVTDSLQISPFNPVQNVAANAKADIEKRTDLQLSKEQINLAELDKKATVADYYPSLAGVYNYSVTGYYDKVNPFKSINDNWMKGSYIGLQLKIPVFSGFSRYNQVKQKDFALQKARNTYELMKQSAQKEIADATNNYLSANNSFENASRSLELAQDVFRSSETEYRNGIISLSDMLQIQNDLTTARNNYSVAMINVRQAEIDLKKANGALASEYNL